MSIYSDLLKQIEYYSQSEFEGVYSRPYFKHVLMRLHNSSQKQDFSLVYGDFNQLNDINNIYSPSVGDELIKVTFKKMHDFLNKSFPDVSYSISRIGGDEFVVFVDTDDTQKVCATLKSLVSSLNQNSLSSLEKIYGDETIQHHKPENLDFFFGLVSSSEPEFSNVYDMYTEAEKRESLFKMRSNIDDLDFDETLKLKMEDSFHKLFKNFRLSNYIEFDISGSKHHKDIKDLMKASIDSISRLLQDPDTIEVLSDKLDEIETSLYVEGSSLFTEEQANEIHTFMTNTNVATDNKMKKPTYLKGLNANKLSTFLNELIRNPISGFYNESYLHHFFTDHFKDSNFSTAIFIDTVGMKDCNFKHGHLQTDGKLTLLSNQIESSFENLCDVSFSNENFKFDKDGNYIFNLVGGNYLILTSPALSMENVENVLSSASENCEPLSTVFSMENIEGQKNLVCIMKELEQRCKAKKEETKKYDMTFVNSHFVEALDMFLAPTLKYYLENSECDYNSMTGKKQLVDDMVTAILNQSARCSKYYKHLHKDELNNEYK